MKLLKKLTISMVNKMEVIPTKTTFRNYLFFWSGQLFSLLGTMVVDFILIWWIQIRTGNVILLSLASFFYIVPTLIVTPIAGVLSDRLNRKKMIVTVDSLQALTTFILILFFLIDFTELWIVFLFIGISSVFQGIHQTTVRGLVPIMVPKDKLSRVNGVNFLFTGLVQLLGPALGAILLLFLTIKEILWVDIITFFIALVPLLLIRIPSINADTTPEEKNSFFKDFKVGFSILRTIPGLLTIVILTMFLNFLIQPISVLSPYYINIIHGGDIFEYALFSISIQAGIILGAIVTTLKKQWKRKIRTAFTYIVIFLGGYAFLAIIPIGSYVLIVIGIFIMGFSLPIINTIFQTIIQTVVPPDKIGRVLSINSTLCMLMTPIGIILSGPLSVIVGITNLFLFCGIIGIIITIATYLFTNIRHTDYEKKIETKILEIIE